MANDSTEESFGCQHYKRNCKLLAPCCNKVYSCRVCHDDDELHVLDRKSVEKVVCRKCEHTNDISATCAKCETVFGTFYFCPICRLYDNVDKKQFHCDGCGICRAGGSENYEHCTTCEMCMPKGVPHKCIEKSSQGNCPVCFESIHSARVQTHIPQCGHLIHSPCYKEMMKKGLYSCPTCGRAMGDMSSLWGFLDSEILMTPMPQEYQELYREILCKDCSKTSKTKFHVVGMKCGECGSYNTSIEGPFVRKDDSGNFVLLTEAELEKLFHVPLPGTPLFIRLFQRSSWFALTLSRFILNAFNSVFSFILWPLTVLLQGDDILYPDNDGGDTANVDLEPREVDEDNDNQSASGADENDSDWQTEDEEEIDSDSSQHERDADHMEDITDNNQ